jgi:hypothetical protein
MRTSIRRWIAALACALVGHRHPPFAPGRVFFPSDLVCLRCGVRLGLPVTTQTPTMPPAQPPLQPGRVYCPPLKSGDTITGDPMTPRGDWSGPEIPLARIWAYLNDPIVHGMTTAGRSPDEIIDALARDRKRITDDAVRVAQHRLPTLVWKCSQCGRINT